MSPCAPRVYCPGPSNALTAERHWRLELDAIKLNGVLVYPVMHLRPKGIGDTLPSGSV